MIIYLRWLRRRQGPFLNLAWCLTGDSVGSIFTELQLIWRQLLFAGTGVEAGRRGTNASTFRFRTLEGLEFERPN